MSLASIAQILGLAVVTAGVAMISVPWAFIFGGAFLVLIGTLQEL